MNESVLVMNATKIKYGVGATYEVGVDMLQLGAHRVMVAADPNLVQSDPVVITMGALRAQGIDAILYQNIRIEPSDASLQDAIAFASEGDFDGYVAVGGGSTMDTAKVANLYATHPAEFLSYVDSPFGERRPIPGPLRPMIAIPTTAGTGSETTGTAVFSYEAKRTKTAIAHRWLRPVMGIIDPNNTRTLSKLAAASTGFDVLCHAIESMTATPYHQRTAPSSPEERPPYQGANPISDVWAARAIEMVTRNIVRVVEDPEDDKARAQMILASTFAGMGFGNAGVHLPHAMSFPIAGLVRDYLPEGYTVDHPMIPHGVAVLLTAPAVFRFTASADPARHAYIAQLMGTEVTHSKDDDPGEMLAAALIGLMRRTGVPNGLSAVGYTKADVPQLVAGTIPQQRLTKLTPRPWSELDLENIFLDSLTYW
jgi:hydroxyacid-oxoacid transhydrogenase